MKKLFKWVVILLAILLSLVLVAAIVIPMVYLDDIETMVQEQVNESINAQVSWEDMDLSILSSFPSLTLQLKGVSVKNNAPFEGVELANIEQVDFRLALLSVLGDNISIEEIGLRTPRLDVRVLEDGTANYDITLSDTTEVEVEDDASSSATIAIEEYFVANGSVRYDDRALDMTVVMEGLDHRGEGDFGSDRFVLSTSTDIEDVLFSYDGIDYLKGSSAALEADIDADMTNMKFTFKENELQLDRLPLQFDGWVALPDDAIDMNISWASTKNDLASILSLVPADFAKDLDGVQMSGSSSFEGFVKGRYTDDMMPAFALNASVKDGRFKYPDLPSAVEDIQLRASIESPEGQDLDRMVVHVPEFVMSLAGQPVEAKLLLKNPISDPLVDAAIKTRLDLGKIGEVVPMEKDDRLKGIVDADVVLKGAMSSLENEDYDKFHAAGSAVLEGMEYVSRTTGFPVIIDEMRLAFDPRFVEMSKFTGALGGSDLASSGRVDNYLGWYLKEEGLKGRFTVHSNKFDLDELMASNNDDASADVPADSVETGIFEVPEDFDVEIVATADEVLYDGMKLKNVAGKMVFHDQNLGLKDVFFRIFGGEVRLAGDYNTKDKQHPYVDMEYDVRQMDIQEAAKYMNTIQTMAPIAMSAFGKFSTKMSFRTELDQNMDPIYESILGDGNLNTYNVTIEKFRPLTEIAKTLKMDRLSEPKISDTRFKFKLRDGKMVTEPFNVKIDQVDAVVSGTTGMDQSIDYDLKTKIPTKLLGGDVNGFVNGILGQANQSLGSDMKVGDVMDVNLKLTGTIDDPKVKPSFAGGSSSIKETITNQVQETVKEEVENLTNEALEEAQKQADKLMQEANKQAQAVRDGAARSADQLKKEGYAQAQKLEDDASGLAKIAAKVAADKLRSETDRKAQQIIDEGNRKADGIVNTARTKSDNLIKAAQEKAP